MSGCLKVPVRRRLDLLTLGAGFLKSPVALPVVSISYIGRMCGRHTRLAELAGTMKIGAASPLSVGELESTPAGDDVSILHAKSRDLCETAVAGPALLAGAIVRIRRDVAIGLLCVART